MQQQQEVMRVMNEQRGTNDFKLDGIRLPKYTGHERNERWATRVLAIIGSTLKGQAGQWYLARKHEIYSAERQKSCKSLGDYVSRFRNIVLQVEDMTEIDKVVYFSKGLMPNTRQEILYKRCETLTDAITVAMDYERSHFGAPARTGRRDCDHPRFRRNESTSRSNGPESMEIDSGQEHSLEECRRQRKCYNCFRGGHIAAHC
ncbi:hypothetical protein PHYSODRAFT_375463, partial [Phytophthora sojae]